MVWSDGVGWGVVCILEGLSALFNVYPITVLFQICMCYADIYKFYKGGG